MSVMASVLGGIYADSFVTGFALTAGVCAVAMPVIRLVAPGPEVAHATPGRPVTRA